MMPALQIPAAQIQSNNRQQPALNLNISSLQANPQYTYPLAVHPQQLLYLQYQQNIQLQQILSNPSNAYTPILYIQPYPFVNQVMIPSQSMNYVASAQNMPKVPMAMQNPATAVYTSTQNQQLPLNANMKMNQNFLNSNMSHSNMLGATLPPPTSTAVYQNVKNNISNIATNATQYECANSRSNSPRLSPKLLSISEDKTFDENQCILNEQYLNSSGSELTPSPLSSPSLTAATVSPQYSAKKGELVVFKYPARAQLNIFISKNLTQDLLDILYEKFPNSERLYYYLDISTALQINDNQMYIFEYEDNGEQVQIIFVNYDLHCNETGHALYGFVTANKEHAIKQNKWMWKLEEFMTATEINNKFGVAFNDLPKSSRTTPRFQNELKAQEQCIKSMNLDIIENADWFNIQQIKSLRRDNKRNKKYLQIVAKINESKWAEQCKKVWHNAPAIPIVVKNKNGPNKHWIEWVKLIGIDEEDTNGNKLYVGVSCRYLQELNEWEIKSICLDKGDIENKHRLVGLSEQEKARYLANFNNFQTTIAEIQWIRS